MTRFIKRHTKAGARPGTLVIPPDAPAPRIRVLSYDAEAVAETEVERVEDLSELAADKRHWIAVQGLGDEAVIRALGNRFGLHPLVLEDVVNVPQRPKIEAYPDYSLLVTRVVEWTPGSAARFGQVAIIVGANHVLTFEERPGQVLQPIVDRLRAGQGPIRRAGSEYLAYAILDAVVDGYYPVVQGVAEVLEQMEARVLTRPSPRMLDQLGQAQSLLVTLRRVIVPQRAALDELVGGAHARFSQEVLVYFRDTLDHCSQLVEGLQSDREVASSLMNTYLSVMGHRTNDIMKVLTIMASIFIPLTFLAGIYGMNFEAMPELQWRWSYPTLIAVMILTALGMVAYFWKVGWLKSGDRDDDRPFG